MSACAPTLIPQPAPFASRWTLPPIQRNPEALPPAAQVEEQEGVAAEEVPSPSSSKPAWGAFKLALGIIGVMAIGSAIVSIAVLEAGLVLLGFCVALSMMTFIGMPLILAAIADLEEAH